MTRSGYDTRAPGRRTDVSPDPETRLARNRDLLRQRLADMRAGRAQGMPGAVDQLVRTALPLARRVVRTNPYASLGGAMLAGMILMRWKPWRSLGGSFLAGWLVKQAFALPPASIGHALEWLSSAARTGRKPGGSGSN